MPYDPRIHHRRSIRLPGYDYTSPGAYFVTICTHRREPLLGEVVDGEVCLSVYGRIAEACWRFLPRHFPHVRLDAFVVMPNHIHGIIWIVDGGDRGGEASVDICRGEASTPSLGRAKLSPNQRGWVEQEAGVDASPLPMGVDASPLPMGVDASPLRTPPRRERPRGVEPGSLGAVVGNFKSVVTRRVNRLRGTPGAPFWQRNYHERIIRDERALRAIRRYIRENPMRWERDRLKRPPVSPRKEIVR